MDTAAEPPINPNTLRVRRHRERRRERVRLLTVEMPRNFIDAAVARGLIDAEQCADAWAVIQACYAAQVSDATLDWLVRNQVVTSSQRGDAAAILRGISYWLERTKPSVAR